MAAETVVVLAVSAVIWQYMAGLRRTIYTYSRVSLKVI
jgi:hypothetical protein